MKLPILRSATALSLLLASFSPLAAEVVSAGFDSATTIPVTAAGYTATGNTVDIQLNYAPTTGTDLTLVKNTSMNLIQGTFDNLAQGQIVKLTRAGIIYQFVANYRGGSGNDLVLQWATHRLASWGYGQNNGLGSGSTNNQLIPAAVDATGILNGKTILSGSTGYSCGLVACSDGTLASWGLTRIGSAQVDSSKVPVAVDQTGVLAGKTPVAVSCGYNHSLVLCSDGTLASWGLNSNGQLGNNSNTASSVPVLVDRSGVLANKEVVAISTGSSFSVVLCTDGTIAAWGSNVLGELGNNSTTSSKVPVLVDRSGVLSGKIPVEIATGSAHTLVLCSDGTLASWGHNGNGQLGIGSTASSLVPVLVSRSGTSLAGKTVAKLTAGIYSSYALCSDNSLHSWGANTYGELGWPSANLTTATAIPNYGSLTGKTITSLHGGYGYFRTHCSDGTILATGANFYGQLGNNSTTNSSGLVKTDSSMLKSGERFVGGYQGTCSYQNLALIASPPPPIVTTSAATTPTDASIVLNGTVNPNLTSVTVKFEYGLTPTYGSSVSASPSTLTGNTSTAVSAAIGGLLPGTTYYYRAVATNASGSTYGENRTFTTTDQSVLSSLTLNGASIAPAFSSVVDLYATVVSFSTDQLSVTPVAAHEGATVRVNGTPVVSGAASVGIPLVVGANSIQVAVDANDGINTKTYTISVTRLPGVFRFTSASTVPLTLGALDTSGLTAGSFELNFAPTPGTTLTAISNTGAGPIRGTFSNLAQGQIVRMTYAGIAYDFAANYFGGSGNDLVLVWAHTRLLGWGINSGSQVGAGVATYITKISVPTPVLMNGVLAGKTVLSVATRSEASLALFADGTLATWNSTSTTPQLVNPTGALSGKTPVAVTAGYNHFLVLCSDGTLAAWGTNTYGQLGNNSTTDSSVPVAVNQTGVLAGKTPVAISAGEWFNLVLCSDGTLAAWGSGNHGRLGYGDAAGQRVPTLVDTSGVLAGKRVVAISAGSQHALALCSDGTLATWGANIYGQLGNNTTTTYSNVPVAVNQTGVLSGKTVVQIDVGQYHNYVRCSDGTLFTWGHNSNGQLGNNSTTDSGVPVAVVQSGVLNGKSVKSIASGLRHNMALCTDGSLGSWGDNWYGVIGNNTTTDSSVPLLASTTMLRTGEIFTSVFSDNNAFHCFAVASSLPPPTVTSLAASQVQQTSAVLNASVNAAGTSSTVTFEYGTTTAYGSSINATPGTLTGSNTTSVSATLSGLTAGTSYHFRVKATNANGTSTGQDMVFAPSRAPVFSGYSIATSYQTPALISPAKLLAKASDPDGNALQIASAGASSTRGGTATLQSNGILYSPPALFSGTDTFPVTIRDSGGAIVSGTVTVTVGAAPTAAASVATTNPPKITRLSGGGNQLTFHGIPGRSYGIQRSTDLTTWTQIATVAAASNGVMTYTDPNPPPNNAFYRLALP